MKIKLGPFTVGLCLYERCMYYMQQPHPRKALISPATGQPLTCAYGHPACRLGKLDMILTYNFAAASVNFVHQYKTLQCRLCGHIPYMIPAPPRVNVTIIACQRCGKKLHVQRNK